MTPTAAGYRVRNADGMGITEGGHGFAEIDAVLAEVGVVFLGIPDELQHSANLGRGNERRICLVSRFFPKM